MNDRRLMNIVFFLFLFVMVTIGLAFAERECTHQVVHSDGTITITTDCSSSYTKTSENFWNQFVFRTLVTNLLDNVQWGMQNLQDRVAEIFTAQAHAKQIAGDMLQKEQSVMEAQQTKHQEQEIQLENLKERQEMQLENLKERQEMQKQQQRDLSRI